MMKKSILTGVVGCLVITAFFAMRQFAGDDSGFSVRSVNAGKKKDSSLISGESADSPFHPRRPDVPVAAAVSHDGLRINEFLASNQRGVLDDQGETSDWVEVHNSSASPIQLHSFYLTDEEAQPKKWAFPDATLEPNGFHVVWMSGSGKTELSPEEFVTSALTIPMEEELIAANARWKYWTAEPGTNSIPASPVEFEGARIPQGWTELEFDDSNFKVGTAGFGYGDEDDKTELPSGTTCVLLRHQFTLEKPVSSETLVLQMEYDDGFVAYLNGTRVCAANANRGKLTVNSLASESHESAGAERFDLSEHADLLRLGKNVLAIVGLNTHAKSTDFSLNPALGTLPTMSHANFTLPKKGGSLILIRPDGTVGDRIRYHKQLADQSFGRIGSSENPWGYFPSPTPGKPNTGRALPRPAESKITFSPTPGVHRQRVQVQIKSKSSPNVTVRYTMDGSEPGPTSQVAGGPVQLEQTSLIRAASFVDGVRLGVVVSATYVLEDELRLPIMSVTMKPEDFEDVHLQRAGLGRAGERPAFVEFIDQAGKRQVATGAGFRLHGGAGRRGPIEKKKSYRFYFRKLYGDGRVDFPLIPEANVEDYDKLVFRANSNDGGSHGAYIRDQVIRDLHRDMGGLASAGDWCILMINSMNHGVYNVVERMDEEFFVSHLGPGQFDVIKTGETVLSGSREQWNSLRAFIASKDFADPANYETLSGLVDIENFTAYMIINLWAQNFDWPHNNWYAARRVPDGKWMFLCWDAEWGLAGMPRTYKLDPYAFIDSGGAYGNGLQRNLFFALLSNPGYREYYQNEVRRHLSEALKRENVMRQVVRHRDRIQFDIENEFERKGSSRERWQRSIGLVEEFVQNRNSLFQKYTDQYFSESAESSSESDRVALMELDQSRHVIFRTQDRQLHELVSSRDGTGWQEVGLSELVQSPSIVGSPDAFVYNDARHVIYRGKEGHLHLLSKLIRQEKAEGWKHQDLTAQLELPVADCDPAVAVDNNIPHIVYRSKQPSRIHEIWFDDKWRHHPLPAAPRPRGGVGISASRVGLSVSYQTVFGTACEQTLRRHHLESGERVWDSLLAIRIPTQGVPLGFQFRNKRQIVYQAAGDWPKDQPFVFYGRAAFPKYRASHRALVHASTESRVYRNADPIGTPELQMAGDPCLVSRPESFQYFVAYRDERGAIQEASYITGDSTTSATNTSWSIGNISQLASAPPAVGDPEGYWSDLSGEHYYVYRGEEGHLHELRFDGKWRHLDLSDSAERLSAGQ